MSARQLSLGGELLGLLEQSVWANRRWIEFIYSRSDPETRPKELLAHIVLSERVWLDRVEGRPEASTTFAVLEKGDLLRGLDENRRTFQELAASRLGDVIHFRRASGEEYDAPVVDILHQFLTHGYHHRGQIAAHYATKGVPYPNTDHINYLIENRL
jgi:uncharacterized damage-inducible protein DinB